MLLDWSSADDIAAVRAASPSGAGYNLLLGADVAYGQAALPALFSCAEQLLERSPEAAFLLGEALTKAVGTDIEIVRIDRGAVLLRQAAAGVQCILLGETSE